MPRLTPVTVNLPALVARHPDWARIRALDASVAALEAEAAKPGAPMDVAKPASLPSVDLPPVTAQSIDIDAERTRLEREEARHLARIVGRRSEARALQLERQYTELTANASRQYDLSLANARDTYAQGLAATVGRYGSEALNLDLKVHALENTTRNWSASDPGTPVLARMIADLAVAKKQRDDLLTKRRAEIRLLRDERDAAFAAAERYRAAYVTENMASARHALEIADRARLKADKSRLGQGLTRLLALGATIVSAPAPSAGTTGPVSGGVLTGASALPDTGALAEADSLRAARGRLARELADEAVAASEDVARDHHWRIVWSTAASGLPDRTDDIARSLATGPWRKT